MSHTPYTNLQATLDFSNFQFSTETTNGFVDRLVRFRGQKGGQICQVDFQNREAGIEDDPSWPQSDEFLDAVVTLVLIVEIYSERYPMRVLRFSPDSHIKAHLFGNMCGRFKYLLETLFTIKWENHDIARSCENRCCRPFLLRRKPTPYFSVHSVETNWRGTSRIFNNRFKIELEKSIRIDLTVPDK